MEASERVAALKASYTKLPEKDHGFAESLIKQFEKKGSLSPKQMFWVDKLLEQATGEELPVMAIPDEKETVVVGDFSAVYALFAKAKEHLKFPKIKLLMHEEIEGAEAKPLVLSMAGSKSKKPGVVNLTDGGKYGENLWYGRVYPDGKFEVNSKMAVEVLPLVTEYLKALAGNPAKVVAGYGKLTGHCSFCNSPLSHENSTAVGFGPVCAKHFGLYDEWKIAAKAAGMSDVLVAVASVEKKKFTLQKNTGKTVVVDENDEPTVGAPQKPAIPKTVLAKVRTKKKLVVDREQDEYLF